MTFVTEQDDEVEFLREITSLSDRIVGLLAPVILERRLLTLIKSRLTDAQTRGGTVFSELFGRAGELGDHDTRLRVGLAMKFYSSEAFEEMRYITKIRNVFAHELSARDFTAEHVRDLWPHLKMVDKFPAPKPMSISSTPRDADPARAKDDLWKVFAEASTIPDLTTPKNRYIRSIELFSLYIYREQIDPSNGKPRF